MTRQSEPCVHDLVVAILAGGAARRMGSDKALLLLPDGRPICAAVLDTARAAARRVMLLVDTAEHAEILLGALTPPFPDLLLDETPGAGPLGALAGALRAAPDSTLILLAVDMPLVRVSVLQALYAALGGRQLGEGAVQIAAPVIGGMVQPMPACYDTRLTEVVDILLRAGRRGLRALLEYPGLVVQHLLESELGTIDPDLRSFIGANTPAEWESLCTRLAHGISADAGAGHGACP